MRFRLIQPSNPPPIRGETHGGSTHTPQERLVLRCSLFVLHSSFFFFPDPILVPGRMAGWSAGNSELVNTKSFHFERGGFVRVRNAHAQNGTRNGWKTLSGSTAFRSIRRNPHGVADIRVFEPLVYVVRDAAGTPFFPAAEPRTSENTLRKETSMFSEIEGTQMPTSNVYICRCGPAISWSASFIC